MHKPQYAITYRCLVAWVVSNVVYIFRNRTVVWPVDVNVCYQCISYTGRQNLKTATNQLNITKAFDIMVVVKIKRRIAVIT